MQNVANSYLEHVIDTIYTQDPSHIYNRVCDIIKN